MDARVGILSLISKCRWDHYSDREQRGNKNFYNHSTPLNDHIGLLQTVTIGLLHGPKIRSRAHARFDPSPWAFPAARSPTMTRRRVRCALAAGLDLRRQVLGSEPKP